MKEIKLNGVSFNLQAVANYSNAEDFYSSPSHQHYWGNVTEAERHKRLTFVYEQAKVCKVATECIEGRFENMNFTDNTSVGYATKDVVQEDGTINTENSTPISIEPLTTEQKKEVEDGTIVLTVKGKHYPIANPEVLKNDFTTEYISDDSSATDNKPEKSKRSRRNSKDAD
jgi:hypothetical protein